MDKTKLTGIALALGAATMFSIAPVFATSAADAPMVQCKGANGCKGQGSCKTADNACKGQNGCKGKGVVPMTKEACEKAGGTVVEEPAANKDSEATQTDTQQ